MKARLGLLLLFLGLPTLGWGDGLIPTLTESQASEARRIIEGFKTNPRGPFFRIQWFCNDGSVHPPSPPPCADKGGGHQHASLSPEAKKLAEWNVDVGTILTAFSYDQLFDAERGQHRLKELVAEHYLEQVDSGWIYRRAYSYRGARQIEDEEKSGHRFLVQLLSHPEWVSRNYFLVTELIRVIPHGLPDSAIKKVRTLATSIAGQDSRFQSIRAKIHSDPSDEDLAAVERFLGDKNASEPVQALLLQLAELLKQEKAGRTLAARLPALREKFGQAPLSPLVQKYAAALQKGDQQAAFSAAAELSLAIRGEVGSSTNGRRNLELLDFNALLQEFGFQAHRKPSGLTRGELLADLLDDFRYATGGGLLSNRQFAALRQEVDSARRAEELQAGAYRSSILYLSRSLEWCRATAAKDFIPVEQHYQAFEPKAKGLLDDLLRGSIALPLAAHIEALSDDANRVVGLRHSILGTDSSRGVVGLNPGVTIGRLGIIESAEAASDVDPRGIYVIPETVSDIRPMAGMLTLDSGNALSHAQLLAANLGIPNATIPSSLLPELRRHQGNELFFAVTRNGVVVLREKSELTERELEIWSPKPAGQQTRIQLDTSRLDLSFKKLLRLDEIGSKDSGVIAGPKAANLGQLASYFPGKVAAGVVIPFGVYEQHVNRVLDDSGVPLGRKISDAFDRAEQMRREGAPPSQINAFMYPQLAAFRAAIQGMPLLPWFDQELTARLQGELTVDNHLGVFVRSDTNAEDLPQFTGAGLNLTVANAVGVGKIRQAVKDVWASPFTERAYSWRSRALEGTQRIYPSVIVMRAVPVDKSGVIATVNLETGNREEITVNVSEGVGAVVGGGVAESLLLKPNGEAQLLQQGRTSERRVCNPEGGFSILPAEGPEYLLSDDEIRQVRELVAEVDKKYPPAMAVSGEPLPWDIEFGFERGELRLFQIRPLVRYRELATLESLSAMEAARPAMATVRLDQTP